MIGILRGLFWGPLLLLAAALWLGGTESGLDWTWRLLRPHLPAAVSVESVDGRLVGPLTVRGLRVDQADGGLELDRLTLDWRPARLLAGELHIASLDLEGPHYTGPSQPEEPEEPPSALGGFELPRLSLALEVTAITARDLVYTPSPRAEPLRLAQAGLERLRLDDDGLELTGVEVRDPGLRAGADVRLARGPDGAVAARADWRLVPPERPALTGRAELDGSRRALRLSAVLDAPYAATLDAQVRDAATAPAVILELDAREADTAAWLGERPAGLPPTLGLQLSAAGTWSDGDYRFDLRAKGRHERAGTFDLDLAGRGDRDGLTIDELTAAVLDGTVTGNGEIVWQTAPRLRAELRGRGLNPGRLDEAWPGRLNFEIAATGGRSGEHWRADVSRLAVDGRLRDRDLKARATAGWDGQTLHLRNLRVASGGSRIAADGRIGERWELAWTLDSPDLGDLLPGAAGELNGEGTVHGRGPGELTVQGRLRGGDLRYRDWAVETLTLEADVDLSGTRSSEIALRGEGLRAAERRWDLRLDGAGRPRDHRLELALSGGGRAAELTVAGDWRTPDWRGRLIAARLEPGFGPAWTLAEAAEIAYLDDSFRLGRTCLVAGEARACAAMEAAAGRVDGRFELDGLPLALTGPLLPPEVAVEGALSASGGFGYAGGAPRLDLEFRTTGIAVRAPGIDDEDLSLGAAPGGGRLRLAPDGGELAFDYELRPAGRLHAGVTLGPGTGLTERALGGEIAVAMPDLAPFAILSPELDAVSGRLDGALELGGRLEAPVLAGELALTGGRVVLPRPGLTLSEVELRLTGDGAAFALSGGARSGDGRLALSGRLRPGPPPDVELRVTGRDFRIFDTRDARVAVSPDLDLTLAGRRAGVRGTVHVPGARITPRDIDASGAVPVSRDQVIVRGGEEAEPPLTVDAEVRLTLGDDIRVAAFGLDAGLGGALTLRQQPGRSATATGELEVVGGEYRAYGQSLKIEVGRLLYTGGPVDNPGLDVRASRRPREDVTVGVTVRGTLREPDFRLFSEPAMSQTRQLSWLVLGRPLEQTSGGESSALAQAAIGLGLQGSDFFGRRLQGTLGLDTLGVESEAGGPRDQAAFVIGKYLSPRLYVSYGIGLLEPVNVLKLRYEISRRWTLLTESGTESGGDITYSIER